MTASLRVAQNRMDHDRGITHTIVHVTAETAKRWLDENNTHNRRISTTRVEEYASDMSEGRWHFNGEAIQFDRDNVLLNGQHRLMAILATGIAQTFLIVSGLDRSSQITMDQGTRRGASDQLLVAGIVADTTATAAIRVFIKWQSGRLFGDLTKNKVSTSEIVEWAQDNPDLVEMMAELSSVGVRRVKCAPSVALAVALRFALIDLDAATEFFGRLSRQENMTGAVLALHRRLDRAESARVKLPTRDVIAYFTTAWNAWRDGRTVTKVQRPRGAVWSVENFPQPK